MDGWMDGQRPYIKHNVLNYEPITQIATGRCDTTENNMRP